jgi:hypothetical protein
MKLRSGSSNNIRDRSRAFELAPGLFSGFVLAIVLVVSSSSPGICADGVGHADATHVADSGQAGSNPASFGELLEGFAQMSGLEARYEEEKFLSLLAVPLRSSGRLYFAPPASLLRRVEAPSRQDILIRANQIRISSGGSRGDDNRLGPGSGAAPAPEVQTIDLAARGGIRPLVESMIWIFTGDRASLESVYDIDYQRFSSEVGEEADQAEAGDSSSHWQVRLTPKAVPLSNLIRELRVRGRGFGADKMELVETSGDRTVTQILDADPRREFSAVERLELFGAGD